MIEAVSPEEVRRITENVLEGREFQKSVNPWELALNWFRDFLGWISQWAANNPDSAKIVIYILSFILALLIAHITYTVIKEFTSMSRENSPQASRPRPLQALEGIAENWADAFHLARAALESGDLYRALWITHRVLLSALDRMDVLRFARWKTNRDYLHECRADHSAARTLADVSDAYERVVYAHGDIRSDQAASLLSRVEVIVQEASR